MSSSHLTAVISSCDQDVEFTFPFQHVRSDSVTVTMNPHRKSLKMAEHLRPIRSSERLAEDEPDMYALQGVYYLNNDTSRCKKGKLHRSIYPYMLQRLQYFGIPSFFPTILEAEKYKDLFSDLLETLFMKDIQDIAKWRTDKQVKIFIVVPYTYTVYLTYLLIYIYIYICQYLCIVGAN